MCRRTYPERLGSSLSTFAGSNLRSLFCVLLENGVGFHNLVYLGTGVSKRLSDVGEWTPASDILIRLHGALMLASWIGTASIGMLLARYYRQTWVNSQLCGKDHWFAVSIDNFSNARVDISLDTSSADCMRTCQAVICGRMNHSIYLALTLCCILREMSRCYATIRGRMKFIFVFNEQASLVF